MNARERWIGALNMAPIDRLPFWPKFDRSYLPARRPPFSEMNLDDIHEWIGSDRHVIARPVVRETYRKCACRLSRPSPNDFVVEYETPHGVLRRVARFNAIAGSRHPVEFPIKTVDDIALMIEMLEDVTLEPDAETIERTTAQWDAFDRQVSLAAGVGKSPLMRWVEELAGIENSHMLLMEYPDEVEALFDVIVKDMKRRAEIMVDHQPGDALYLMENTSTTLISPEQYRRYCAEHKRAVGRIVTEAGKPLIYHMCGHLKRLLDDLNEQPADAFEAFTSPPVGDTTLMDGREHCPEKCLIGGTNAALWMRPADEIIDELERHLDALPHHRGLVITSAGVMPPAAGPETIKAVREWVHAYPARW